MPKSQESINSELDELLDGLGFDATALDSSGQELPVPDSADVLQFHFHADGQEYGTVTISIDGLERMVVYYNDRVADSPDDVDGGVSWFGLLKRLKRFALNHQLSFELKDSDRLRKDMKRRSHLKKLDEAKIARTLLEGYWGNRTTSWSDPNPQIKIVIKHNRKLEEGDARFRNIERIFLENEVGERVLVPTVKPSQARMFARHLAEGGKYRDDRWSHMEELCEDITALSGFVRATRGKADQFNESVVRVISEAEEKYNSLRGAVKQLQSARGYHKYFEDYKPVVLGETVEDGGAKFFVRNTLDRRIESALPVLSKYNIRVVESPEASAFEGWAESLVAEALDPDRTKLADLEEVLADEELELGPDAINAISALEDIIENDDLYGELKSAAAVDPNRPARPVIISWMYRQDNSEYNDILDRIEGDSEGESGEEAPTTPPAPASEPSKNVEPAKVKPAPPKSSAPPAPAPGPALPDLGMLPPLAEDDVSRIIKLSGIRK